jgi:hypothetical protein
MGAGVQKVVPGGLVRQEHGLTRLSKNPKGTTFSRLASRQRPENPAGETDLSYLYLCLELLVYPLLLEKRWPDISIMNMPKRCWFLFH